MSIDYYSGIQDRIFNELAIPYVYYPSETKSQKILFAMHISGLSGDILLVPSSFLFSYAAAFTGITEKQIEYLAKNAPIDYKKEILNTSEQKYKIKEIFEIARDMDDDLGNGVTTNQQRIRNVMQYINDNRAVFQF